MDEHMNPAQEPEQKEATPAKKKNNGKKKNKLFYVIIGLAVVLAVLIALAFFVLPAVYEEPAVPTAPVAEATLPTDTAPADAPAADSTPTETEADTEPTEPVDANLVKLQTLQAQNADAVAWLQIDGTVIDYPVMYTPNEKEKYLYADVEGKFDAGGCLFIDERCSFDPASDNLIIHGHNMKKGTMFAILPHYESKDFWKEHPIIKFTTSEGTQEYEVVAAFYDRVYKKTEDVFKYYFFIDAEDKADYNYAIKQFKNKAEYETGVRAKYGDQLLTLSTCVYHVDNGRFVVVATPKD